MNIELPAGAPRYRTKAQVTIEAIDAVSRRRALTEGESLRLERAIQSFDACVAKRRKA